jgi:hypothetical protein
MKRLLLPLAAVAIVGLLLPTSVRPAYACTCAIPTTDERVQEVMENSDAVLLGAIAEPSAEDELLDKLPIDVETIYMGPALTRIRLDQSLDEALLRGLEEREELAHLGSDCSFTLLGDPGERYLLFLYQQGEGVYTPGGCSSIAMAWTATSQGYQTLFQSVERLTAGGTDVTQRDGAPWLAIIVGSSLGAAALAAASAFLLRRRLTRP